MCFSYEKNGIKINGKEEKGEDRIEKSVSRDHNLSSLSKSCGAIRRSLGQIFLSHPYIHDRFL